MRTSILPALWSFSTLVIASVTGGNAPEPPPTDCIGYNAPDCIPAATTTYCTTGGPDCSTTIILTTTSMASITHTPPQMVTTITVSSGTETSPDFYSGASDSFTPRPPPPTHSTRPVDTATPTASAPPVPPKISSASSATASAPCTYLGSAPPAIYSQDENHSDCTTIYWTGSTYTFATSAPDVATYGQLTPATTPASHPSSSATGPASKTTLTSTTTTTGVGYPGSSGTGSVNTGPFTGQGVKTSVTSVVAALLAVGVLPFLPL